MAVVSTLIFLVLVVSAFMAGCRGPQGFGEPPPASPRPVPTTTASPDAGPSLRIRAPGGLRFEPSAIRAPAGATVEILFENRNGQDHTFMVDELTVLMLAGPGQSVRASVALHPRNRGTFAFYCRIPGHREGGMEGRITVG
jgi:uncharacterized cupredoxin-like copper-binding protein